MPANCPLLKDLNLKLVNGPPTTPALAPAGSPAPAPAPVTDLSLLLGLDGTLGRR